MALVLSNVPEAGALERAARAGVARARACPPRASPTGPPTTQALVERLRQARVDLVGLAGYMRLVTPGFLRAFGPSARPAAVHAS